MLSKRTARFLKSGFLVNNFLCFIRSIVGIAVLITGVIMCARWYKNETENTSYFQKNTGKPASEQKAKTDEEIAALWEKGYDLPVDGQERESAETDCKRVMELVQTIYKEADKGEASNVVLSDKAVLEMQKKMKGTGCPIHTAVFYSNMANNKKMDNFLKKCQDGENGSIVVYEIRSDGGVERTKYIFDGTNLYLLSTNAMWNEENELELSDTSHTRIKEWKYSDKGWFCYQLCVPEYPEVSEMVDGSCLIRIKPLTKEQRRMSKKCVSGLGYQGNNLLCSNWDAGHMDKLDYNGMYEYLYAMKYGEKMESGDYPNGIPKKEFESLIMEYLPVTAEQIRRYAVFDKKNQAYAWVRLGCFNYEPSFFATSFPEVTKIKKNHDGTVTLTVDAVCEMVLCDDALITHELTVKFTGDGKFQYLGNKILHEGNNGIPEYQYRIRGE